MTHDTLKDQSGVSANHVPKLGDSSSDGAFKDTSQVKTSVFTGCFEFWTTDERSAAVSCTYNNTFLNREKTAQGLVGGWRTSAGTLWTGLCLQPLAHGFYRCEQQPGGQCENVHDLESGQKTTSWSFKKLHSMLGV